MAVFKCKMCGGNLEVAENNNVMTCEYCGTRQTLPKLNDDIKEKLYDRAGYFRRGNEYDKAMAMYEKILNEDNTDAEAYWSIVLCKYGVEYVEDPVTHRRMPTCNRTQLTSILADENYKQALEHALGIAKSIYEEEAQAIDAIQKGILEISHREEPFDVFICYKETGNDGQRTRDSVLAQEIYQELTKQGYKVFFSRITLEKKLGTQYEPYIFAALNSAKVMLAVGTKPEHFNAVWVKNEWSRYLALIKDDRSRLLIPCYRDMDVYELPDELSMLQGQDMGKIGFLQDLLHGVKKVLDAEKPTEVKPTAVAATAQTTTIAAPGVESLMKRGWLFLEDDDFKQAIEYFDRVLDIDAEYAPAYVGKLCAELKIKSEDDLAECKIPFNDKPNYQKAIRFADETHRVKLTEYSKASQERHEKAKQWFKKYSDCISAGSRDISAGLKNDGTVVTTGNVDVSDWHDIVAVSCGSGWVVGLKADGTVVEKTAIGLLSGAADLRDVVAVSTGTKNHAVGLKADGTVVVAGNTYAYPSIKNWRNIVAVSAGESHTIGLKSDGTVVLAGNRYGYTNIESWRDIISVSAGNKHTVGLRADGTVIADGSTGLGRCNTGEWNNIVAVSAGFAHTVGLKSDGTVVAVGLNDSEECSTGDWNNIVAVSAGFKYTLGLRADGTVVELGNKEKKTGVWRGIGPVDKEKLLEQARIRKQQEIEKAEKEEERKRLEEEERQKRIEEERPRAIAEKKRIEEERKRLEEQREQRRIEQSQKWEQQGLCKYCGGQIGGLFTKKCKSCGKEK